MCHLEILYVLKPSERKYYNVFIKMSM